MVGIWVVDSIDLHKIMMRGGDPNGWTLGPVDQCMPTQKKRKKKKKYNFIKMSTSVRVRPRPPNTSDDDDYFSIMEAVLMTLFYYI